MSLIAKDNSKNFKPLDAGTHISRLVGIIYIGTITDTFNGEDVTRKRVFLSFETPNTLKEDGTPFTIGQEFTLSMNKNGNLLPFIESMLGRKLPQEERVEFDVYDLLGQTAMLNVLHSEPNAEGRFYANIKSVSPVPESMEVPAQITVSHQFDYEDHFNGDFVWAMHENSMLRKKIMRSEEWLIQAPEEPKEESAEDVAKEVSGDEQAF